MTLHIPFDNSYARLPERFYVRQPAAPVRAPRLLALNDGLVEELNLDPAALRSAEGVAMLAGNAMPEGADPLAQAYAGHQFGGWSPQLGDGRALLLGEVLDREGRRRDIALKGSGPTPFSRMGDGRAWLGPVLREYLVSEAMHALGIPTSRALAAVATGDVVLRERPLPGAVLTRVAASHIRVGTFQFFAARGDIDALKALADHVIARHYPQADDPQGLFAAVVARQAKLIAAWMSVGFVHGVMNTDNCQIAGETIDYGPCAFMDAYASARVFSAIDSFGRYAYDQQPDIALWNLAQFGSCLLPLMDGPQDAAAERLTKVLHGFPKLYAAAWKARFTAKLGLREVQPDDDALIEGMLAAMEAGGADFTNTFAGLATGTAAQAFADPAPFEAWAPAHAARCEAQGGPDLALMARSNPAVIPRNHRVEQAIDAAVADDLAPFRALLAAVTAPFAASDPAFTAPPGPGEAVTRTFCGT